MASTASEVKEGAKKKKKNYLLKNLGKKHKLVEGAWNGASLYIRTEVWPKNSPNPKFAIVLVEKVIRGERGDDDTIEYNCYFYDKNGIKISELSATISLDFTTEDQGTLQFTENTFKKVKDLLSSKKGFTRDQNGLVNASQKDGQDILNALFEIVRSRAKAKKGKWCGIYSGVLIGLGTATFGVLVVTGTITVPAAVAAITVGAGLGSIGFSCGKTTGELCYRNRAKIKHEIKSCCCGCCPSCCPSGCSKCCSKKNSNSCSPCSSCCSSPCTCSLSHCFSCSKCNCSPCRCSKPLSSCCESSCCDSCTCSKCFSKKLTTVEKKYGADANAQNMRQRTSQNSGSQVTIHFAARTSSTAGSSSDKRGSLAGAATSPSTQSPTNRPPPSKRGVRV